MLFFVHNTSQAPTSTQKDSRVTDSAPQKHARLRLADMGYPCPPCEADGNLLGPQVNAELSDDRSAAFVPPLTFASGSGGGGVDELTKSLTLCRYCRPNCEGDEPRQWWESGLGVRRRLREQGCYTASKLDKQQGEKGGG